MLLLDFRLILGAWVMTMAYLSWSMGQMQTVDIDARLLDTGIAGTAAALAVVGVAAIPAALNRAANRWHTAWVLSWAVVAIPIGLISLGAVAIALVSESLGFCCELL